MREEEGPRQVVYAVTLEGTEESAEKLQDVRAAAEGLREEVAVLKEEPLTLGVEGEVPKPPRKKEEEDRGQGVSQKRKKKEEKESLERVSGMISAGLVQGFKSGDVKGALADLGTQLATTAATTLLSKGIGAALSAIPGLGMITSFIPGIGPLLSGLLGGLNFQTEGLVRSPTLALVAERDYGYLIAIC
jgi:hypothetical protein